VGVIFGDKSSKFCFSRFEILFLQGELLLPLFSRDCSILWMGLYGMDSQTNDSIEKFKLEVRKSFSEF